MIWKKTDKTTDADRDAAHDRRERAFGLIDAYCKALKRLNEELEKPQAAAPHAPRPARNGRA